MKQITPEIKARIFALYWGTDCAQFSNHRKEPEFEFSRTVNGDIMPFNQFMMYENDDFMFDYSKAGVWMLIVKPISSITDEDTIKVANIATEWNENEYLNPDDVPYWLDEILTGNCALTANYVSGYQIIEVIDYLRSRGYALPAFSWSVDELVTAGVFKLRGGEQ